MPAHTAPAVIAPEHVQKIWEMLGALGALEDAGRHATTVNRSRANLMTPPRLTISPPVWLRPSRSRETNRATVLKDFVRHSAPSASISGTLSKGGS